MTEIREYLRLDGRSAFARWYRRLDARAAAKVTVALLRLEQGNMSSAKSVGAGIHELRIDFGPGYRVYFAWDGPDLVILLGGGDKRRQDRDIRQAKANWQDYKTRRKRNG